VKELPLSKCSVTIVDEDVYEWASKFKWSDNGNGYAVRNEWFAPKRFRKQYLHRLIAGANPEQWVDHINGNKSDNRKENLRVCTSFENSMNRKGNKRLFSKYKGVSFNRKTLKWTAKISIDRKSISLGTFVNETDAAKAYNEAAFKYAGEFAYLNVIEESE
jgi:hypothetical protein